MHYTVKKNIFTQHLGDNTESKIQNCDTDSITSADSQKSQSFLGLTWLFASNNDLSKEPSGMYIYAPPCQTSQIIFSISISENTYRT